MLISDVRCLVRRNGLRPTLAKVGRGISDTFQAREDLLVVRKPLDAIAGDFAGSALAIEDLTGDCLAALGELNRRRCEARADRRFADNVARGYRGFVARHRGAVVGFYWWIDRRIDPQHPHLEPLGLELGDDDAYGFDFFLAEEHRGEGNAIHFLHEVETRLRERGYRTLWGYVMSGNTGARWLYAMRGYEVTRKVEHVSPGRMRQGSGPSR